MGRVIWCVIEIALFSFAVYFLLRDLYRLHKAVKEMRSDED